MFKAQKVLKNFKTFKANWIAKDIDGNIYVYNNKPYKNERDCFWEETGDKSCYAEIPFDIKEFKDKHWEECLIEREHDYSDWIGKLCWFWEFGTSDKVLGVLGGYKKGDVFPFHNGNNTCPYTHCAPVRKDEVEFVE